MKEIVLNHPMITHKLSILRSVETSSKEFREIISELSMLLCYEATRNIAIKETIINTPLEEYKTNKIDKKK